MLPVLLDAIRACLDDPSILQIGCRALVLLLESSEIVNVFVKTRKTINLRLPCRGCS